MPLAALQHYARKDRSAKAREWGQRSAANRKPAPDRWEEICRRSADNMRGKVWRHGTDYSATIVTDWAIVRSGRGRINQHDLLIDGVTDRTGRARELLAWVR